MFALVVTALGVLGLGTSPASADPPSASTPQVTVRIASMTPATTNGSGTLTITGKITNSSTTTLRQVQVYLWRDTTPATTSAGLATILQSQPDAIVGRRAIDAERATWDDLTPHGEQFQPGQSASFTVSAPIKELGFSIAGVYPVGVQVRSQLPDGSQVTTGRARTLLPVQSSSGKLTWSPVVELTSRPSLVSSATFSDNHLVGELGGRLAQLVARARERHATVVIDPALLDEVEALTTTHEVEGTTLTDGQLKAAAAAASAWLAQVKDLLATNPSYRLPYGNPDLITLQAAGDAQTRDELAKALTSSNPAASLPLAVVAPSVTAQFLSFVQPLHPRLVIGVGALDGTDQVSGLMIRGVSSTFGQGGPSPAPTTTAVQQRQRVLAGALLDSLNTASLPLSVLISSSQDLALEKAVAADLTPRALDAESSIQTQVPTQEPTEAQVSTAAGWQRVRNEAINQFDTWGDLTGRTDDSTRMEAQALARSLSMAWSTPARGEAFLTASAATIGNVLSSQAVHVTLVQEFVLSSPENRLPATVTNTLDTAVTVRLTFDSENPQRIDIPPTPAVTVPAGETVTVQFNPHAHTNGTVNMTAQLRTTSGRPIGPELPIVVRATSMGRVGWIIVIASGALFVGATAMRVRQVQHERAREERDAPDAATLPPSPPAGVEDDPDAPAPDAAQERHEPGPDASHRSEGPS